MALQRFTQTTIRILEIKREGGIKSILKKIISYFKNNFYEKWRYIYLVLNIEDFNLNSLKKDESLVITIAEKNNIKEIKKDLYPYFDTDQDYFKHYIERIGEKSFSCFLAKKGNKIVHYFLVFNNAVNSPLYKTPLRKSLYYDTDAYLGNAFTLPSARGMWILPVVMNKIMNYLSKESKIKRVLVLVHKDTPGAVGFYKRLGFKEIEKATILDVLLRKLRINSLQN